MKVAIFVEPLENVSTHFAGTLNRILYNRELSVLLRTAKKHAEGGDEVIFVSKDMGQMKLFGTLGKNKNIFINYLPYPGKREYEKLEKTSVKIVNAFYTQELKSMLQLNGIDFSDVLRHMLLDEIMIVLKWVFGIMEICKKTNMVIVQNKNYTVGRIAQHVCHSMGIEFSASPDYFIGNIKQKIKQNRGRKIYFDAELYTKRSRLWKLNSGSRGRILVDSKYVNSLRNINPVAKILSEKDYEICVVSNYHNIKSVFPWSSPVEIKFEKKHSTKKIPISLESFHFDDILVYNKIKIWPLLKDKFEYYFGSGFHRLLSDKEMFEKILIQLKPSAIVVGDDRVHGTRCHVLCAKKYGIKAIEIPHGMDGFEGGPINKSISDIYMAGGKIVKNIMIKYGTDPKSIKIIGWPRYDDMLKNLGVVSSLDYVLFAPDAVDTHLNVMLVMEIAKNISRKLIVKPHPGENEKIYYELLKQKNIELREKTEDITPFIMGAYAVIALASTACIQTIALRKPLIIINTTNRENMSRYIAHRKCAIEITKIADIRKTEFFVKSAMNLLKKERNVRKLVADLCYKIDGQASKRAAKAIIELIQG